MAETLGEKKARLKLIDSPSPIFEMDTATLRSMFAFKNGELHTSRLIKNLIWDDHKRILRGDLDLFEGNIRSYWYARVKPALARAQAKRFERKYPMMINQFVALIVSEGLFGYSDFGFSDVHARHRLIGTHNPHLILVAEKTGMWPLLLEMHDLYSITVLALGGHPSAMATVSFISELKEVNLHTKALRVLTLVDYDPAGASITRTLMWQMKQLGFLGTLHLTPLMNPAHLTREQVRLNKFHLPNNNRTRKINTAWSHKTGGLSGFGGGRFEGLEVDALPWPHIRDLVAEQLTPHLRVSKEDLARRQALGQLVDTMRKLLERRLFGP